MELTNLQSIEIHYENCEIYKAKKEHIKSVFYSECKPRYVLSDFPFTRSKYPSTIEVTLHKTGDIVGSTWLEEDAEPFHRTLERNDIVYLYLIYDDGKKEKIFCPWEGDSYFNNPNQHAFLTEQGELTIQIKESNK